MIEVQFFEKEKSYTYVDLMSSSYDTEKEQLTNQGYIEGVKIKAKNIDEALSIYNNKTDNKIKEYTAIGFILGLFSGF